MQIPETQYTRTADGLRLAYQLFGEGPPVLIVPPLVTKIEVGWEHPAYRRVTEHMGRSVTWAGVHAGEIEVHTLTGTDSTRRLFAVARPAGGTGGHVD